MPAPTELTPDSVLERYTVECVLGEGGMAVVYRVRHKQLGSIHALKVLTLAAPSLRERLVQEGRVQASLRHPNIVSVTDIIDVGGAPGLIMEFIEGPNLEALLEGYRPNLEEAEALGAGILRGVAAAHKLGLIHRDLKPANVLIALSDAGPVPKVADFGLARLLGTDGPSGMRVTRSGQAMGTPSYMAPEQIRNAKGADKRADVFSLGAILYDLACGAQAFPGDDILTVFTAITTGSYASPSSLVPGLPQRMVQAIEGALQVNPDDRIPDCETLLALWTGAAPSAGVPITRSGGTWSPGLMSTLSNPPRAEATPQSISGQTFSVDTTLAPPAPRSSTATPAPPAPRSSPPPSGGEVSPSDGGGAELTPSPATQSSPPSQSSPAPGGELSRSDRGAEVPAGPPEPAAAAAPVLPPTGGGARRAEGGPAAAPAPAAAQTPGKTPPMSWAGKAIDEAIMEPRGVYVPASARRSPVSPLARAVADDIGVKLDRVTGTGPGGRVVRADVEAAAKAPVASPPTHTDTSKRITQMRKTIARRLTDVHQQVPVFYLTVTFDMNAMVALKASAAAQEIKVSYNDLLLKAVARCLRDVPEVNAAWMGDTIVERGSVDIGVAVALPEGLITPIIRNADAKSVTAIAAEIRELAGRAKAGKLQAEEYTGGSFTISNLGMLDIESFTAILNPPEAAILALGAVEQVPVVVDGQLAVGWRLKATMTCDHRVVDGALGARFLQVLRRYVESPAMLVL